MKQIICLTFLLTSLCVYSQEKANYYVSSIDGIVRFHDGKNRVELVKGQALTEDDILTVSAKSSVTLLNPKEMKMYTIKGVYSGALEKYLKRNEQTCVTSVTKQYMRYMLAKMVNKKSRVEQTEEGSVTVYRSIDSIIQTIDSTSVNQ